MGDFAQTVAQNWADWYEWVTFSWKICVVYFQFLQLHIPTNTKLEYPPPNIRECLKYMMHKLGIGKLYWTWKIYFPVTKHAEAAFVLPNLGERILDGEG